MVLLLVCTCCDPATKCRGIGVEVCVWGAMGILLQTVYQLPVQPLDPVSIRSAPELQFPSL